MKVWAAAAAEPDAWTVTATDSALTAAGQIGLTSVLNAGNTNATPVVVSFDDYQVVNPQTFTIAAGGRGLNGVYKTHPAGAQVRVRDAIVLSL